MCSQQDLLKQAKELFYSPQFVPNEWISARAAEDRGKSQAVRMLIVSDHPLICMSLMALFEQFQNIQVIGHTASNADVPGQVEALEPDVALLDCYLIHIPGYVLSADIFAQGLTTHFMALVPTLDPIHMKRMLAAGVRGFAIKTDGPEDVIDGILSVGWGKPWLSGEVMEILMAQNGPVPEKPLSTREFEVLNLVARGYRNQQIAEALSVEERTVRFHLGRIYAKLGVKNRVEASRFAFQQGWIGACPPDKGT